MAGSYTGNLRLYMPAIGETGWGQKVNNNFQSLDNSLVLNGAKVIGQYASLNAAVSAIGVNQTTLFINQATTLTTALTIPATISIIMVYPGVITSNGNTLTINGSFFSSPYQVFNGFSSGQVTFGSIPMGGVQTVWFGVGGAGLGPAESSYPLSLTKYGTGSLLSNTTGHTNTAYGEETMLLNTTGNFNCALGVKALRNNDSGFQNDAIGVNALRDNITGAANDAFGVSALQQHVSGDSNTAIGNAAMYVNVDGYENTAVGVDAMQNIYHGNNNVAIGRSAMLGACPEAFLDPSDPNYDDKCTTTQTSVANNIAIGRSSMALCESGAQHNIAIGSYSQFAVSGIYNVSVGENALNDLTSGNRNIAIGEDAGYNIQTGDNNTIIGYNAASVCSIDTHDAIIIGANAGGPSGEDLSNQIKIGTTQTEVYLGALTLAASTYTPTLYNGTNVASSSALSCQYMRMGPTVTVSGQVNITPTTTGATDIGLSIPFASTFANANELGGTGSSGTGTTGAFSADASNARATFTFVSPGSSEISFWFSFTYRIIV